MAVYTLELSLFLVQRNRHLYIEIMLDLLIVRSRRLHDKSSTYGKLQQAYECCNASSASDPV